MSKTIKEYVMDHLSETLHIPRSEMREEMMSYNDMEKIERLDGTGSDIVCDITMKFYTKHIVGCMRFYDTMFMHDDDCLFRTEIDNMIIKTISLNETINNNLKKESRMVANIIVYVKEDLKI